ncbi:protein YgfX [Herbaspirillum sp. C9C3]|uniref:protein YgfX n=1 Tax=Herbaspirillum sp. C9C3 TaxID=2735271 RepID=UPI0015851698|nr:protein YgfX [Herbaspirillum sp. C9C3]NUT59554.1 flagellar hook-length control protein [Herbaspirillum sp. C9C3]
MSIAVSADIKPSRLLLLVTVLACLCVALTGVALAFGMPGSLSWVLRIALAVACVLAAALALVLVLRDRKVIWLHISGTGQIRVVEHLLPSARAKPQVMKAGLAQLLAGSTIWPGMLFLRLRLENGRTRTIPILTDSVSEDTFRALSVACRWLISHNTAKARLLEK